MRAKRYIYLLFALFSSSTGIIAALYFPLPLFLSILIGVFVLFFSFYTILLFGHLFFKYIRLMDKKFSWSHKPVSRLTISFNLIIVIAFFITLIAYGLLINIWNYPLKYFSLDFWSITLRGVMSLSLIYTIEEAFRFMRRVSDLSLKAEKRKSEQIKVKLEVLKKQINPHFLFNCFNVLAELVHVDSEKSDEFVTEMGKIYRYVLDQNKDFVVTLGEELEFIQSFIFLQQIRFEKNLVFKTDIGKKYFEYYVPPLTLELLVENAIKHNQISSHSPLVIEITVEGDFLIVKNNYQPRQTNIPSNRIGLKNLREQYELISEKQPEFLKENGYYIARVPLLKE